MINTIFYLFMFILGAVLGSFYTLAIYRIPLKQDITHTRSYCPKCNHKLNFWDLIPILSYIFLGGKCRYCKQKIRPRYIIIEVTSGLLFLGFAVLLKLNLLQIEISKIIVLVFAILLFSTAYIQGGILKEYKKSNISVFNFGIIIELIYMIYLYVLNTSIYRYVIYILAILLFTFLNNYKKTPEMVRIICFIIFIIIGVTEIAIII